MLTRTVSRRSYPISPLLLLCCGLALLLLVAPGARSQGGGGGSALAERVAALEANNAALAARVDALEAENAALLQKTKYLSVSGTDTYFTGTNLHVRNGMGATNGNPDAPYEILRPFLQTNGLGNLFIGYNEAAGTSGATRGSRDGSHNLVIGYGH
jgi:hypothetical protein